MLVYIRGNYYIGGMGQPRVCRGAQQPANDRCFLHGFRTLLLSRKSSEKVEAPS